MCRFVEIWRSKQSHPRFDAPCIIPGELTAIAPFYITHICFEFLQAMSGKMSPQNSIRGRMSYLEQSRAHYRMALVPDTVY